jgi:SagB-type dehydrogenase family enzyme
MKTQLIPEATLCNDVFKKPGIAITLKALKPATQKALEALCEGCEEDHLAELVEDEELTPLYYHLEELRKHGFLHYRTPFLDMFSLNEVFSAQNFMDIPYCLSRFTLCRLWEGKYVIESPLSPVRGSLSEVGVQLLHALSKPTYLEELSRKFPQIPVNEIKDTLSLLVAAKMIATPEDETSSMAQWEFHDLLFHTRSRRGRIEAPYGGTFRFRGIFPSEPGTKKCTQTPLISLMRPEKELELSLEQAMAKRKSIREHGQKPINLRQLGEFLWRCARVKESTSRNNEEFTSRPYPGGGARYELEIYPVVYQCEGLEAGVYHYHPREHQLCKVCDLDSQAEQLLIYARDTTGKKEYPQVLFCISARFQRVSWKYQSMAYAVILKNLGVLIQTMYLVATASDLAPCAVGGGDSDLFCKVTGTNYLEETSVGEFMLGSLPR